MASDRAVVHLDLDPVSARPSSLDDGAGRRCPDGGTAGGGQIQTGVQFPDMPDGVETHPEAGGLPSSQWHGEQGP
ncbi:MAG: hypothetical protein ACTHU1_11905 [Arachnia sp.]